MNKGDKEALLVLGGGALIVSFLPIMRDPYYHVERVNFWEWSMREIEEVLTGERAHAPEVELGASAILSERNFVYSVDLGCGLGSMGQILNPHTLRLVGVDKREDVYRALNKGYDEVSVTNVKDYAIPEEADSVFMFECIEHLSKEDGLQLIQNIPASKFLLISTPSNFFTDETTNHLSLWTPEDFYSLGFNVMLVPTTDERWGNIIFAVRDPHV